MKIPHFLLAICVLAIPAHAHHGPFEKESESRFHEMHLGMAQTLDPNGVSDTYSVQYKRNYVKAKNKVLSGEQ